MSFLLLAGLDARAAEAALYGDVSDPVRLMEAAGCDVSSFFEYGDWRGVDFRNSDLNGVSFLGADMLGALVTEAQLEQIAATNPRTPPENATAFGSAGVWSQQINEKVTQHKEIDEESKTSSIPKSNTNENSLFDLDKERAIIGALLSNNDNYFLVSDFLKADHFFDQLHGRIFAVVCQSIGRGKRTTASTVESVFSNDMELVSRGTQYFSMMCSAAVAGFEVVEYGRDIRQLALRRQLLQHAEHLQEMAQNVDIEGGLSSQFEIAENQLFDLANESRDHSGVQPLRDALTQALDVAANAYQRDERLIGLSSGLVDLDDRLGGFHPRNLIVLAGASMTGKSNLARTIAFNVASSHREPPRSFDEKPSFEGTPVCYFSLAASAEQIATSILASQSRISTNDISSGSISEGDFNYLVETAAKIERMPLFVEANNSVSSISGISIAARRLRKQFGLSMIIVDRLDLMPRHNNDTSAETADYSDIMRNLKRISEEFIIPVIVLAQLPESTSHKGEYRPNIKDLELFGNIEKYIDVALFLHRGEIEDNRNRRMRNKPAISGGENAYRKRSSVSELVIAKNPFGPTGSVMVHYNENTGLFSSLYSDSSSEDDDITDSDSNVANE